MRIRKVQENKNYTIVHNDIINCSKLSAKAKGLYLYLFSKPDHWSFSGKRIANDFRDGSDSIYAGLKELEEVGLLKRKNLPPYKDPITKKYVKDSEYIIYDYFQFPDFPESGFSGHIVRKRVSNKYNNYKIFKLFKKYYPFESPIECTTEIDLALLERFETMPEREIILIVEKFFNCNDTVSKDFDVFVNYSL